MRRYAVPALVAVVALWFAVVAYRRGQFWIALCLIGIAVLRAVSVPWGRKPPEPGVRLNLTDASASQDSDGPDHA